MKHCKYSPWAGIHKTLTIILKVGLLYVQDAQLKCPYQFRDNAPRPKQ
jgi:hypothetical protein